MDDRMPRYEGIMEPWKVELITSRAKRMGFHEDEVPDLLQDLALVLGRFRYDPVKANGAKESTVLQTLIDNHLLFVRRTAKRYRAHVEFASHRGEPTHHADEDHLAIDVRHAVAMLPEREQFICRSLAEGRSRHEIARRLGCGWYTLKRAIKRIAEHFEELGLEGWLDR